jgi:hypothetical protein
MYFSCLGASMLGRGLVLVLVCISLLCAHARSEFEGTLCRGVLGTPMGRAGVIAASRPCGSLWDCPLETDSREPLHSFNRYVGLTATRCC